MILAWRLHLARAALPLATAAAIGCGGADSGAAGGDTDYMDDQPPAGSCVPNGSGQCTGGASAGTSATSGATSGSTTGALPDECKFSADCPPGQICVAAFDGDTRMPYACVEASACVPDATDPAAEAWWCADDLACCSAGATCSDRGLCEPGAGTSTSTGTGGGATSTTGG